MNRVGKSAQKGVFSGWRKLLWLSAWLTFGVHAEDTEIYRPPQSTTPYVLLLLDTSGSMSFDIDEQHPGRQRMPAMKRALNQLLDDAEDDYHIGLARYTSPGGAILYPVSRLGEHAGVENAFWGETPADDFMVRPAFVANDPVLLLSAEENTAAAIRVTNVSVPRGAEIESASLVVTTDTNYVGSVQLRARVAQARNIDPIADQAAFESLQWQEAPIPQSGVLPEDQIREHSTITINVTAQLRSHIQAADWAPGNAMLFEVSAVSGRVGVYGTEGARAVEDADGSVLDQFRPRLYVRYRVWEGNAAGTAPTTVRDALRGVVNLMPTIGDTPLIGAYYEAAQYMLGGAAHYGLERGVSPWRALMRTSHPDSFVSRTLPTRRITCTADALDDRDCYHEEIPGTPIYDNPIDGLPACTTSPAIVMLTDGYPNNERCGGDRDDRCDLEYVANQVATISQRPGNPLTCDSTDLWDCGIKLSMALANPRSYGIERQPIPTFTIGFGGDVTSEGSAEANLLRLARGGYGENPPADAVFGAYYSANSAEELSSAFTNIFNAVANGNNIQAATGVSVDQSNRTQHTDQLYFSLFEPSRDVLWPGNLKRYRLQLPDEDDETFSIVDADGVEAIDDDGNFLRTSRSFWSTSDDGASVRDGGARQRIPTDRRIYSYVDDYNTGFDADGEDMIRLESGLFSNAARATLLNTLLETPDNAEGARVLNWLNRSDGSSPQMGAPIHGRPLLVNYGYQDAARTQSIDTLFLSTNQGLLHAFDSDRGEELFAFAPKELLRNQRRFSPMQPGSQLYGLDASWIAYRYDDNGNGDLRDNNDFVYLYGGMRMGGRNYYALDVTSVRRGATPAPILKFAITPDTLVDENRPFATLGQTWSVPLLTRLADACSAAQPVASCTSRVVMMFGGGYDYDSHERTGETMPTPVSDDQGAGIYLVDALNGAPLWRAAGATLPGGNITELDGMDYSITATLRTLDVNRDGFADHIYAVDLGGQVLRFDLAKNGHGQSMARIENAEVVAQLGGSASLDAEDYRRFYDAPAITPMRDPDGTRWVGIAVGSGYRSHPTNTETDEAFFMIKDYDPYENDDEEPETPRPSPILISHLADATASALSTEDPEGWYMRLNGAGSGDPGEKVVGEPFVLNENLVFATYVPPQTGLDAQCNINTGHMNLYQVTMRTAAATLPDNNNDGSMDRLIPEVAPGLISGVALIQTVVDGERDGLVSMGPRLIDIDTGVSRDIVRTRWRSNEGENRPNAESGSN